MALVFGNTASGLIRNCYCYEKEALDRHLAQQKEPTKPQKKHEMER